jgi:hypothetical protein
MTTLVISDLHLGMRSGRDLLRRAGVRARLLERLDGVDRVVLLGDAIELRHGPMAAALETARPFLQALGAALGAGGEVVVVPGNHDHSLLAAWHERRRTEGAAALGLEHQIEPRPGEPGELLARWIAPARLTLAYPGLWLRPDVYATHGHYLDRHVALPTLERLAIGAIGRLTGPPPARARPDDYEAALAPLYAFAHAMAQLPVRDRPAGAAPTRPWRMLGPGRGDRPPRAAALGAALPLVVAALNAAGLGPLRPNVGVEDLDVAALRAMGQVCARLDLRARYVVFGHMHRAGPRAQDHPGPWIAPTGAGLVSTGSWTHEPALATPDGRYRPGTGVRLDDTGAPRAVTLAGDLVDQTDTGEREVVP